MTKKLQITIISEGLSSECIETYELRTNIPDYFKIKKITYKATVDKEIVRIK